MPSQSKYDATWYKKIVTSAVAIMTFKPNNSHPGSGL
jgi:hypothetical protein